MDHDHDHGFSDHHGFSDIHDHGISDHHGLSDHHGISEHHGLSDHHIGTGFGGIHDHANMHTDVHHTTHVVHHHTGPRRFGQFGNGAYYGPYRNHRFSNETLAKAYPNRNLITCCGFTAVGLGGVAFFAFPLVGISLGTSGALFDNPMLFTLILIPMFFFMACCITGAGLSNLGSQARNFDPVTGTVTHDPYGYGPSRPAPIPGAIPPPGQQPYYPPPQQQPYQPYVPPPLPQGPSTGANAAPPVGFKEAEASAPPPYSL